jgi:DNA-binding NtrC family response regulator
VLQAVGSPAEGLRLLSRRRLGPGAARRRLLGAGLELLDRMCRASDAPVVLLSARPSMVLTLDAIPLRRARRAAEAGAPAASARDPRSLQVERRVRALPERARPDDVGIIGASPPMLEVFRALARAAASDATVLVLGESGTGKEMVARALHAQLGARPRPVRGDQLRGDPGEPAGERALRAREGRVHRRDRARIGRFERAHGGTLFLDEIGDMSLALQAKILRALQEREIERVGGDEASCRSTCASSPRRTATCGRRVATALPRGPVLPAGRGGADLPPLRDTRRDLELLASTSSALRARARPAGPRDGRGGAGGAARPPWPGNVRQLRNAVERAVVMSAAVLLPQHLPPELRDPPAITAAADGLADGPLLTLNEMERRMIQRAIRETGSNLSLAALRLGIHRNTLRRKLVEHGLRGEDTA